MSDFIKQLFITSGVEKNHNCSKKSKGREAHLLGSYPNCLYCLLNGNVGETGQVGQLLAGWVLEGPGHIEHVGPTSLLRVILPA